MRHFVKILRTSVLMLILVSMSIASLGTLAAALGYEALSPVELSAQLYTGKVEPLTAEQQKIYAHCIGTLLEEDLWTPRDMYDTCHYLMLPMYYAFYSGNDDTVRSFGAFFARFVEDVSGPSVRQFQDGSTLHKLHFFYLSTQFMNLCHVNGYGELIPSALPEMAQNFAADYLLNQKANWDIENTVLQHIENVLAGKQYTRRYYRALTDLDLFPLAILCDLNCFHTLREELYDPVLDTAAELAWKIFSSPLLNKETEKGGWLYQPGVMYDHPDYAYAGNASVRPGMKPKLREDVAADSSHSLRFPLWLRSFLSAQTNGDRQALFFLRQKQLANQMVNYVLQKVDGQWLCTTFMDGTNGVYRYEYGKKGVGLAGYDLSGTFLIGWWSLLGDERITARYQDILKTFPMKGAPSNPYFDHATVREQNPFFDMDTAFDSGMFECMTACAAKLRP